jgi:hypothetical protein
MRKLYVGIDLGCKTCEKTEPTSVSRHTSVTHQPPSRAS